MTTGNKELIRIDLRSKQIAAVYHRAAIEEFLSTHTNNYAELIGKLRETIADINKIYVNSGKIKFEVLDDMQRW